MEETDVGASLNCPAPSTNALLEDDDESDDDVDTVEASPAALYSAKEKAGSAALPPALAPFSTVGDDATDAMNCAAAAAVADDDDNAGG